MPKNDTCNWCGHPKRRHAHVRDSGLVAGCRVYVDLQGYCQCSAERGRVRMPATRKRRAK